jgi:hypothetical protein
MLTANIEYDATFVRVGTEPTNGPERHSTFSGANLLDSGFGMMVCKRLISRSSIARIISVPLSVAVLNTVSGKGPARRL